MPALPPAQDIRPAEGPHHLANVRRLFRDYADALGISLDFQDFDAELAQLPGDYAPPQGRLLLAWQADEAVGCVALRPLDEGICEMKRLYVSPAARATGLGRRLAQRICDEARAAGYERMRLDTLSTLTAARRLYEGLGFRPIPPYCFNPIPDAIFLELDLARIPAPDGVAKDTSTR
jgi:ribosomal protein S18 acetylase RimI-like enzyme